MASNNNRIRPWHGKPKTKTRCTSPALIDKADLTSRGLISETGVYVVFHFITHLRTCKLLRVINRELVLVQKKERLLEIGLSYIKAIFDQDNKVEYRGVKVSHFLTAFPNYNVSMAPRPSDVAALQSLDRGGSSSSSGTLPLGADWRQLAEDKKYVDLLEKHVILQEQYALQLIRVTELEQQIKIKDQGHDNLIRQNVDLIETLRIHELEIKRLTENPEYFKNVKTLNDQIHRLNVEIDKLKTDKDLLIVENKKLKSSDLIDEMESLADMAMYTIDPTTTVKLDKISYAELLQMVQASGLPTHIIRTFMEKFRKIGPDPISYLFLRYLGQYVSDDPRWEKIRLQIGRKTKRIRSLP